ncbi:MAG TPA: EAL domain-containing protein [Candidatus Acidoferrum sp.]|nr:EAL domain-containing protein [Candidatus Acidoferrum sp.]
MPVRVWTFSMFLALSALALFFHGLNDRGVAAPLAVPWPLIAAGFCLAELKVVEVHFRRETHSFSLSEFPAVIGFFFLTPVEYMLALFVGTGAALIFVSRQSPIKVFFNLSNFALTAVVGLSVFARFAVLGGVPGPNDWIAAFAASLVAVILGALTIATVISLSGGAPQFQKLPDMLQFGGLVAVANTSLALLAVSIMWIDTNLLWLLAVPVAVVFLAYRAWVSEREKHERLELLYQSSRILQHSPELDSALVALLDHARDMFRAERAEVILYPRGADGDVLRTSSIHEAPAEVMVPMMDAADDPIQRRAAEESRAFFHVPPTGRDRAGKPLRQAMVSPLRGESGLIGLMIIANRLTEGTSFADDDLRLLETLANQAAVALENGQLEQSLHELSRLKEQLRHQAYHDPLTGLANRTLFGEQVNLRLASRRGGASMPVVLFLDLDDFKVVNDTLGHAAGDRLLIGVADRIRACVRAEDVAARLGGDEFAILLEDDPSLTRARTVADRIVDALRVTFPIQGQEIAIGASIGIAAAGSDIEVADELLRNADVAMYTAKGDGRNKVATFEPTMHTAIVARHELSVELARGVARGELVVFYQPIIALATGEMSGVEALVRWRHPTRGLVGPDDFIGIAEESGTILALGRWVLAEACHQMAIWQRTRPAGRRFSLAVNLSAAQLREPSFVPDLVALLEETGLDPRDLVLEMTETVMFQDTNTTIARLETLRALGIRIAVDDFGTGYSSLGYLRRFKVDVLKIAREFIGPADSGTEEWAFAHAIVALGRTLDLRIVAEGIEEPDQLVRLRALGCEFGQGFLFGRPVDAASLDALIVARDTDGAMLARPTSPLLPLVPSRRARSSLGDDAASSVIAPPVRS